MLRISPEWEAAIAKPRREAHLDGTSSPVPIVPWLAPSLHPELRELLARLGSVRRLAAGENVINPEEPVSSLVLVTRGVTGRSVGSPDGQSSEAIAVSTPGHIAAGNLNFFTRRPAFGRYFALTPCEIVSCPSDLLRRIIMQDVHLLGLAARQFEACTLSDRLGFGCIALLGVEMRCKVLAYVWAVNYGRVLNPGEDDMWLEMPVPLPRISRTTRLPRPTPGTSRFATTTRSAAGRAFMPAPATSAMKTRLSMTSARAAALPALRRPPGATMSG